MPNSALLTDAYTSPLRAQRGAAYGVLIEQLCAFANRP